MSEPAARETDPASSGAAPPLSRADALASRERILAAAEMMAGDRRISMVEIAAAAGVGRSTLYRHFPTRQALQRMVAERAGSPGATAAGEVLTLPFQAPGQLGRDRPVALEVTQVLDEVPPHLVPDQLVAEARRAGGVAVALYVVDIDGSQLLRLAGSEEFPDSLDAPPALGPEIVPEGLPGFQERLRAQLPGCVCEPLWLRGRVLGLLLCMGTPMTPLTDIAKQGAAALELANDYTDYMEAARRRKPTTPAAEIQQNLFPPRIVRIQGAQLAGGLLPSYEVGGDWFDFVDNRDGTWLAIAEDPTFAATQRQLHSGERLLLVTDGITQRKTEGGGVFGIEGIRNAVAGVENPTAAATAMAILQAVTDCWREPLEDDGTAAVLAIA